MRLGQLARKLSIKTTEILKYLEEKDAPVISNHPNSKIPDEHVDGLLDHFTPSPIEEIKAIIDPVEEIIEPVEEIEITQEAIEEELNSEIEKEIIPEVIEEKITTDENIISEDDLKELAEVVMKDTVKESAEKLNVSDDEGSIIENISDDSTSESFVVETENDEEHVVNVVDGIIKAPKVDLEGLKVVGKIDLPQDKAEEESEQEVDDKVNANPFKEEIIKEVAPVRKPTQPESAKSFNKNPGQTDYEKRQLEINRLKKIEQEKLKKKKEAAKKAYQNKMSSKPKVQPKKKVKTKVEAPKVVNKHEDSKPVSAWGKFMKWLNT